MTKNKPTYILGLACFYHDSSACILKDGVVIAAAQEERFTRLKHDENFPTHSIKYCLAEVGITLADVTAVTFYEKPLWKFERLLLTYIQEWPRGFFSFLKAMRAWLSKKLWMEYIICKELGEVAGLKNAKGKIMPYSGKIYYVPHHLSHAASTYYPSGFSEASVLTVDGVGEWSTTTLARGNGSTLKLEEEIVFPDSLGLLYSAFTYYLGFKVNSGEYKVMGLAPYGKAQYTDKIWELIERFDDGSFRLKPQYFAYRYGFQMTSRKFAKHFGRPVRNGEDELTQWHKDMAASLQQVAEELMLGLVNYAHAQNGGENLCLSGGVALNCVANGRILREGPYKNVYVFPAAGDAGGSVGAALYCYAVMCSAKCVMKNDGNPKSKIQNLKSLETIYLGPRFKKSVIKDFLQQHSINFSEVSEANRADKIAECLEQNQVIGLFQGRMEFGPRALGNRSIIADPRQTENWKRVNLKIKFREDFRPFAPSVLLEDADEVFDLRGVPSPYMLLTTQAKAEDLPAITHVNGSARIQTVSKTDNKPYHDILSAFKARTGCSTVINTSFNVRGEPIVCDHVDAFKCFLRTDMDVLVLENFVVKASEVDKEELKQQFELEVFGDD